MPSLLTQTKTILREHGLRPQKRLGQSFLVDANILNKILEAAQITPDDIVLEIGPGTGALTEALLSHAWQVIAVEYDKGLYGYLQGRYKDNPKLVLMHGDYLKINLSEILANSLSFPSPPFPLPPGEGLGVREKEALSTNKSAPTRESGLRLKREGPGAREKLKVVANLPYYISTPLLFKLIDERLYFDYAVLMLQKEVVARLTAHPGTKDYGALTLAVALYAQVENIAKVSRHCFYPAPEVDSALIKLSFRGKPAVELKNEALFNQIVRAAFGQRRKTLGNALKDVGAYCNTPLPEALKTAGIDGKRRGETLSLEEFARLANQISQLSS